MKIVCVIPARWSSSRLPGKPLKEIGGLPMIEWVYNAVWTALEEEHQLVVATDDNRILDYCQSRGMNAVMTSSEHATGTERVVEVSKMPEYKNADIYINVQGDEPLLKSADIKGMIISLEHWEKIHGQNIVGTLLANLHKDEACDRNCVKAAVKRNNSQIIMFTRSCLYDYETQDADIFRRHVGIYAFTKNSLKNISKLKNKTNNEVSENLEQMRWMDHGIKLIGSYTNNHLISVDTDKDLLKVNQYVEEQNQKTV
jgi:3-deoxy-manno-octulosonate cytidylyltransferase (CMP-KDO synthetase)